MFSGPILHLPGNHDLAAPMAPLLRPPLTVRLGVWEIIGFDTHEDHRVEGGLDAAGRHALAARVAGSAAAHVLLACHHPPVAIGCPWLDEHRIADGHELLESVAAHDRVRGLVFGHVHQEVTASFAGLAVLGTPSTCFQFEPGSGRFAIDRSPRTGLPGYRWLELHADGALTSAVHRLAGYAMNIDSSHGS